MISIALATYNGSKYLEELLNSLLAQRMLPDEIIVVDDCSTDDTVDILKKFQSLLPIRIFVNERNLGVNLNFQKAVEKCSGDYILICDQDDIWFPENIQEKISMLEKLPQDRPALVASASILTDKNLKKIINLSHSKDLIDWKELIHSSFQGTTMAFNRCLLKFCSSWPKRFEEFPYDFYLYTIALFTGKVYGGSKSLMFYRSHGNNTSFYSGEIKNFFKKIFPINRLQLFHLTIWRITHFDYVLKSLHANDIHPEIQEYLSCLNQCKKSLDIYWFLLARNRSLPLLLKIKICCGNFFSWLKNLF